MDKATYTKGPWRAEKRDRWQIQAEHRGPGSNYCVALVNSWADDAQADARLIAAAPELFEALTDILDYTGGASSALEDQYVMERARAALSKAGGQHD